VKPHAVFQPFQRRRPDPAPEYVRPPVPIDFPAGEVVPEGKRHQLLRTALFDILTVAFADRAGIGCDQFVYWNARDPKVCVAPDVMLRFGQPDDIFDSWKTWQRGAPHLAVEIASAPGEIEPKVPKYHELGVEELVAFDADDRAAPLRIWHREGEDLVEQELRGARTALSVTLDAYWTVREDTKLGLILRLAHDPEGKELFPTRAEAEVRAREAEARAREAEVRAREAERDAEASARRAAEARIRELEAELARRDGSGRER
jgi:Uma2 family endonuclease